MNLEEQLKPIREYMNSPEGIREHNENELHKFCREVKLYTDSGIPVKDAIEYVKINRRNLEVER